MVIFTNSAKRKSGKRKAVFKFEHKKEMKNRKP
jgi:hypothetical protein